MSETWTIGPAVAADGAAVVDLLTRQLDEHDLPAERERVASAVAILLGAPRHGFLLVAREDGATIGVAFVAMHWSLEHGGQACWLEELYVLPDRRGRGVGRDLLRAAATRAGARLPDDGSGGAREPRARGAPVRARGLPGVAAGAVGQGTVGAGSA